MVVVQPQPIELEHPVWKGFLLDAIQPTTSVRSCTGHRHKSRHTSDAQTFVTCTFRTDASRDAMAVSSCDRAFTLVVASFLPSFFSSSFSSLRQTTHSRSRHVTHSVLTGQEACAWHHVVRVIAAVERRKERAVSTRGSAATTNKAGQATTCEACKTRQPTPKPRREPGKNHPW